MTDSHVDFLSLQEKTLRWLKDRYFDGRMIVAGSKLHQFLSMETDFRRVPRNEQEAAELSRISGMMVALLAYLVDDGIMAIEGEETTARPRFDMRFRLLPKVVHPFPPRLTEAVSLGFNGKEVTAQRILLHEDVFPKVRQASEQKSEQKSGQSCARPADTKKKSKSISHPQDTDLRDLIARLAAKQPGESLIEIARDFTGGNEKRAKSLLRGARRYRHLWKNG